MSFLILFSFPRPFLFFLSSSDCVCSNQRHRAQKMVWLFRDRFCFFIFFLFVSLACVMLNAQINIGLEIGSKFTCARSCRPLLCLRFHSYWHLSVFGMCLAAHSDKILNNYSYDHFPLCDEHFTNKQDKNELIISKNGLFFFALLRARMNLNVLKAEEKNAVEMWHTDTEIKQKSTSFQFLPFAVIFDHFKCLKREKKWMLQLCITRNILHMGNQPWPLVPKFISTHSNCKLRRTHWWWFKVNKNAWHTMRCYSMPCYKQMQSKQFSYELVRLFACFV